MSYAINPIIGADSITINRDFPLIIIWVSAVFLRLKVLALYPAPGFLSIFMRFSKGNKKKEKRRKNRLDIK